jgi:hypothetical protein
MDLDDLLGRCAPQTSPRTADLERALDDLVVATESATQPRRRRLRTLLLGGVTVGVVGVGTGGAMAAGLVPIPGTTHSESCRPNLVAAQYDDSSSYEDIPTTAADPDQFEGQIPIKVRIPEAVQCGE